MELTTNSQGLLHLALRTQRWFGEVAALWTTLICNAVREGWVHPRGPAAGHTCKTASCRSLDLLAASAPSALKLQHSSLIQIYRWLRPSAPRPTERMLSGVDLLDPQQTHHGWVEQLRSQSNFIGELPSDSVQEMKQKILQHVGRSRARRSKGKYDAPYESQEVLLVIKKWDPSQSCPADLCPRAAFQCGHIIWLTVIWQAQLLCGPAILAYRPSLWRLSTLLAVYKRGNPRLHSAFRLIFVKSQMGLLQEGLIALRLKPIISAFLRPCQSGYLKGIDDPHLVMFELSSVALKQMRTLWVILGDFRQAFPRVWRDLLLDLAYSGPGIQDGMFELLASILESDSVNVWLSGVSEVPICEGVPEGGTIGPRFYNLLPDSLVRRLEAKQLGFGLVDRMPSAWLGHQWQCDGIPDENLVTMLRERIISSAHLPSAHVLSQHSTLEASAARALDLLSKVRVPCWFHADDPVFVSSSRGGLQQILDEVVGWAASCGADLHVGSTKTVCMRAGSEGSGSCSLSAHGVALSFVDVHKYLGILWPRNLDFTSSLKSRLQYCSVAVSQLAGLSRMGAISWPSLCELFESKVDSLLDMGRWLFIVVPGSVSLIDEAYNRWARVLLEADWFRNAFTCSSELGWKHSGHDRVTLAVAMRRAKLWTSSESDWHRGIWLHAAAQQCGWAHQSLIYLQSAGITDWPDWATPGSTHEQYATYVKGVLRDRYVRIWREGVASHSVSPPYYVLEAGPGRLPGYLKSLDLPVSVELQSRHWCKLRCGLILLVHLGRRASKAKYQDCIFCGQCTSKPTVHCMSLCPSWRVLRQEFSNVVGLSPGDSHQLFASRCLSTCLESASLQIVVRWAAEIDVRAQQFWAAC